MTWQEFRKHWRPRLVSSREGWASEVQTAVLLAVRQQNFSLKVRAPMAKATIVGVHLAKDVFEVKVAVKDGLVLFQQRLSRLELARLGASRE